MNDGVRFWCIKCGSVLMHDFVSGWYTCWGCGRRYPRWWLEDTPDDGVSWGENGYEGGGIMKSLKIPMVENPDDPSKIYFRLMYRTFFFGPFDTKADVSKAMAKLDKWDSAWDYDCYTIIRGMFPLPEDYVTGFPSLSREEIDEIEIARRGGFGWAYPMPFTN